MTNPLRIAVDARPFSGVPNGYTTYISSILAVLGESSGFEITLLTNQPIDPFFDLSKHTTIVIPAASNWAWEQSVLPNHLQQAKYDVYFAGANRGIPWRKIDHTVMVLGLLDIIPFKFPMLYLFRFPFHFLRHNLVPMLTSIWRADQMITISEASARDIKVFLASKQVTPILIQLPERKVPANKPNKQFVYIGGNDPRKRIDNLIKAFALFYSLHPDYRLVLLGKGYEAFDELIGSLQIKSAIDRPGYVEESVKQDLLSRSVAVVYPSLYEGYGVALADAFMAGVPVISGEGGAQAEIGGMAAIYIDPTRPAEIAEAMERLLDPAVRKDYIKRGQKQLKHLTDPAIKQKTVEFFSKLVKQS